MNKVFLGIILAVCILGMLLVMLNDRLGRKAAPRIAQQTTEMPVVAPSATPEEMEANARALEIAEAARALAGETRRPEPEQDILPPARETPSAAPEQQPAPVSPRPMATAPEPEQPPLPPAAKPEPKPAPAPRPPLAQTAKPEPAPRPEPAPAETRPVAQKPAPDVPFQEPAAKPELPAGAHTVTRYVIYARERGATVRIGGNSKMDYSSMTLENPDRVVLDIAGAWKFPPSPGIPRNDLVSAVRVGRSGDKTRIVIDLKGKPRKVLLVPFKNGDGVDVRVDR